MWSKFTSVLKHKQEPEPSSSQGDVLSSVLEQHPNLSVFHPTEPHYSSSSPPSSPSKKMFGFKRLSRVPPRDEDSGRPASPLTISIPKKVKNSFFNSAGNGEFLLYVPSYKRLIVVYSRFSTFACPYTITDANHFTRNGAQSLTRPIAPFTG